MLLLNVANIDWTQAIFMIIGGLGLFLYGIHLTGESLKLLAGNRLKKLIEKTTNTPLKGIFMGIFITVLLQTSSGTTALTISLVRAGLMTLPQAIGIILGANIGTTVTSFLIGLNIKAIALPMIGIGAMSAFFFSIKRLKRAGSALLGFGLIFYGLDLMGSTLKTFAAFPVFEEIFLHVSNTPILGVIMGALVTFMVQSSSATIAILQDLYTTGAIPLIGGIAIVLGSNIGTTITAFISSIGGSVAAKRTAVVHIIFNLFGSILFLIIIVPYTYFVYQMQLWFLKGEPLAMTISLAHIFFNLINTIIMYFFIKQLVIIAKKVVPGDDTDTLTNVDSLQERLIKDSPPLALEGSKKVIIAMGDMVKNMFDLSVFYSFENNKKKLEQGRSLEEMIDTLDQKTHDYLVKISQDDLDNTLANLQAAYVDAIRDFERIADHCQNLFDFFEHRHETKKILSEEGKKDLEIVYRVTNDILNTTLQAFKNNDKEKANQVMDLEDAIDELVRLKRKRYVNRLSAPQPHTDDTLFVDILSNIERIGDHCENVAVNILYEQYYHEKTT